MEGYFRPTADGDPSLTKYRPPAMVTLSSTRANATPMNVSDTATPRGPDSNPASAAVAMEQQRWTEEQMDRSVREAERDRQRAAETPPPVAPGAYDGTTSERDR